MKQTTATKNATTYSFLNGKVARVYRLDRECFFDLYVGQTGLVGETVCYTLPSGHKTTDTCKADAARISA